MIVWLEWNWWRSRCEPKRTHPPLAACMAGKADDQAPRGLCRYCRVRLCPGPVGCCPHEPRSTDWIPDVQLRYLAGCLDRPCHRNRFGPAVPGMAPAGSRTTKATPPVRSPYKCPRCVRPMCFRPPLSVLSHRWPLLNFALPLCRPPRLGL